MYNLSVIVPIYNTEAYLAECLSSIFAQKIDGMEVIAIIDGSPDNSAAIAREFAAQHPNMRVIEQENRGLSSTRNRGIREAQGEYICWIDSDDYYTPDALAEAYSLCIDNNPDFIAMALRQFPRVVEKCAPMDGTLSAVMDGREFIRYTTERNYLIQWSCNYVYRRSFLLENRLFFLDDCVFEGAPFVIKSAAVANRCMYYNAPLTQYRIHEDSLSHSKRTVKVAHDILRTLIAMVDVCESADISAEYMPYFSDTLCKRACFCATTYAELTEEERKAYKAMCTPRELMYFHTFVSPISYRNWLVRKNKKSAENLDKKVKELSKTVDALSRTIAVQQAVKPKKLTPERFAKAINRRARGAVRALREKRLGDADVTYVSHTEVAEVPPINDIHRNWLDSLVSAEAIATRYKALFPTLYYHLLWRDGMRTPLALSACSSDYKDCYEDLLHLLSDGRSYTLLPSFFNDRENVSICRSNDIYQWNSEKISAEELRKRLQSIVYEAVLAEDISDNKLYVPCLYDDIYLDIIAVNGSGGKASARVTDAYLVAKNARAKAGQDGRDVYARLDENNGKGLFKLPDASACRIHIDRWRALRRALCEITEYLSIFGGLQFRVIITKNGPKITRMTANVQLPADLQLSRELTDLEQQAEMRTQHPTQEHVERSNIYDGRKKYWEETGSKRHWKGFRPYMAMMFDEELAIDSQDTKISEEDKLWCYERGFFAYRVPEIGLSEENYRNYVPDYEYFWVNRINNDYQDWITNKLQARFVLDKFKEHLPRHYYNIRCYNGDKRIIALPDLQGGYTQSIDSIIRLVKTKKQLALKRTYGSHGDGFVKFTYADGAMYLNDEKTDKAALEQFLFGHEGLYLITEYVEMHPFIAAMYPKALNTVRVTCMNKTAERGVIGACFLKVGHSKGGYTDNINTAAGGIMLDVDKRSGLIRNSEFKRGNWYTPCPVHPDTGVALTGAIPHWDMIIDGVKRIASELPQIEYMGFDVAVTPEGYKVIEINVFPDYTKFLLKDDAIQAFIRDKVALKKEREKIAPERHSWL